MIHPNKALPIAFALALGLGALALILYAVVVVAAGEFHADFTDTLLWAQATYDSGQLFNPDFYYATAMPFGGQWLMMPFLPLFGVGMAAQTAGMIVFALLLTAAVATLGRRALGFSPLWTAALTAAALLCVSGSLKMRELYWGHIIYYSLGSLFITVGLTLAVRALEAGEPNGASRRHRILTLALVCGWTVLCSMNGMQVLLTFTLPLLGALVLERYLDTTRPVGGMEDPQWRLVFLAAAAGLVGLAAGAVLTLHVPTGYTDYYSSLSGPENWMDNLRKLPRDWLTLLGYAPAAQTEIASAKGIAYLMRFPGAVALTVAPVVLACLFGRIRERGVRLLVLAHMTMSAAIGFAYVFGQIANVNWRLSPLVFTAVLSTVALGRLLWQDGKRRRFALLVIVPVALYALVAAAQIVETPPDFRKQNLYYRLGAFLEEQELDRGYATFWNASSVTLQSDGDVLAAPIVIDGANLRPYRYQSNREWYEAQPDQDTWFLLLTENEYKGLSLSAEAFVKSAVRQVTGPDQYVVLVFGENCIDPGA